MRLTIAVLLAVAGSVQEKVPVPMEADLKEAEKLVRDLFKDEFAKKTPADKRTLAKKLLSQARESASMPASQYALLTLVIDLSIQAADLDTAVSALGEMEQAFRVDILAKRMTTLASLAKSAKTSDDAKGLAGAYLQAADEAVKLDDFENATKAVAEAASQARRAKEIASVNAAEAKSKEVSARKARFEKVRKAKEVLAATPDDADANHALGQYYCFSKGDWASGTACLAKGPEGPLKATALKDLAKSEAPEEMAAVGDGWWDASETVPPEDKSAIRERAAFWYSQAVLKLAGLSKAKVEKRLIQWNGERIARGTWVEFSDPAQFGQKGKFGEPMEITNTAASTIVPLICKAFPPGEYDAFTFRVRLKTAQRCNFNYTGAGSSQIYTIYFGGPDRRAQVPGENYPKPPVQLPPMEMADEYVVVILHSKGEDALFINGVQIGRSYPHPITRFESLTILCHTGITIVDRIRLRKRG